MSDLAWMKTYIGTETALTGHLTAEEFGAYERIRRHYWQHSSVPDNETRLIRVAGADPDRWSAIAPAILPLLAEALPRLDQERFAAASKREKKVAAGRRGAEARWQTDGRTIANANSKDMAEPMANASFRQWPSASASEEVRYEERLAPTHGHARTREAGSEIPFDAPETEAEGREWLTREGLWPKDATALLPSLMSGTLNRSQIEEAKKRKTWS